MNVPANHAGYRIEFLVNGVVFPTYTLRHLHKIDVKDVTTLTGVVRLPLLTNSIISLRLVVEKNDDGKKQQYRIMAEGSYLNVERCHIW